MPYSEPPAKIKDMPKHAQDIWVTAFNAALKEYDDEGKASATAYAAVKKAGYEQDKDGNWKKAGGKRMDIHELWNSIRQIFEPLIAERAEYDWDKCMADQTAKYGSEEKAKKICGAIKAKYGRADTNTMSFPDGFDLQAMLRDLEKEFGYEPVEGRAVMPTQTRFTITRTDDGKARWLMIAASAVVNKVGAIDSTMLFDNFIKHANESRVYPVLDFFHERDHVRFGAADWLHRDGALYLASGVFDDTDLARAAANGLETQPDYWGASIQYRITQAPLVMQAEGEIHVYTDGINDFISIVPKRMAANLFTATSVTKEVRRMDKTAYDELVKLVGVERAAQFAGEVDETNRTITDTGMVTRVEPEAAAPVTDETPTPQPAPETPQVETRTPETPTGPTVEQLAKQIDELTRRIAGLEGKATSQQEGTTRAQQDDTKRVLEVIETRLAGVEASKKRWDEWMNDVPENIKRETENIYRARTQENAPMTAAQLAEQNIAAMNKKPRHVH